MDTAMYDTSAPVAGVEGAFGGEPTAPPTGLGPLFDTTVSGGPPSARARSGTAGVFSTTVSGAAA